ncbi:hypothetical protein DFQ12_3232 [Sphingobacterium detergens]|uniref:Uncharacterized protein n=1 Tax=Sphingobacterium detergens TaxID=1145106 RepID=A0A420B8M8_SPHD1|nr:hypothetical protein DFQ12_3232 [Sphingobacterium detergens]
MKITEKYLLGLKKAYFVQISVLKDTNTLTYEEILD